MGKKHAEICVYILITRFCWNISRLNELLLQKSWVKLLYVMSLSVSWRRCSWSPWRPYSESMSLEQGLTIGTTYELEKEKRLIV